MSKSDVPFWRVTQTLINEMKMPLPSEIGEVGLAYSYGGMKINFPTNNRYPFVSVNFDLHSKGLYTQFLNSCALRTLLVSFNRFSLKEKSYLSHNLRRFLAMPLKPSWDCFTLSDGNKF